MVASVSFRTPTSINFRKVSQSLTAFDAKRKLLILLILSFHFVNPRYLQLGSFYLYHIRTNNHIFKFPPSFYHKIIWRKGRNLIVLEVNTDRQEVY